MFIIYKVGKYDKKNNGNFDTFKEICKKLGGRPLPPKCPPLHENQITGEVNAQNNVRMCPSSLVFKKNLAVLNKSPSTVC